MLGFLRRWQRWVNAALVLVIGGVFVFYMGWGAPRRRGGNFEGGSSGAVVSVGPYQFGTREYENARKQREAQIEQSLGENFDRRQLRGFIAQQAAEELVQRGILALEAERMGLEVSKQEIERSVLDAGIFQGEDGRFDRSRFSEWAQYEFGSERNFMNEQRLRLLATKALLVMRGTAGISEDEVRQALRLRLEEVRIAALVFDGSTPPEGYAPDPAAVAELLRTRESAVRERYEARRDTYDRPEQVHARHILIALPPGADEAAVNAAREKAAAAQKRIEAGEDFAAVAKELSEDPGSKDQGGDLGFFPRGRMVKPFEDAVFALEPGKLAPEPVRSDFGFHVIRLDERRAAELTAFESVREELARQILTEEAGMAAARKRAELVAARISAGEDLESAARAEGLPVEQKAALRRRADGYVPGIGPAPELLAAAFALEPGKSSPRIFESGSKLALVKLLEKTGAGDAEIAAKLASERQSLLEQQQQSQLQAWIMARRDELEKSGELFVQQSALQ